jgi:hypothetical protein
MGDFLFSGKGNPLQNFRRGSGDFRGQFLVKNRWYSIAVRRSQNDSWSSISSTSLIRRKRAISFSESSRSSSFSSRFIFAAFMGFLPRTG